MTRHFDYCLRASEGGYLVDSGFLCSARTLYSPWFHFIIVFGTLGHQGLDEISLHGILEHRGGEHWHGKQGQEEQEVLMHD